MAKPGAGLTIIAICLPFLGKNSLDNFAPAVARARARPPPGMGDGFAATLESFPVPRSLSEGGSSSKTLTPRRRGRRGTRRKTWPNFGVRVQTKPCVRQGGTPPAAGHGRPAKNVGPASCRSLTGAVPPQRSQGSQRRNLWPRGSFIASRRESGAELAGKLF